MSLSLVKAESKKVTREMVKPEVDWGRKRNRKSFSIRRNTFLFPGAVLGDSELRLQIIQHFRFRGVHLKCDLRSLVPFSLFPSLC